MEEVNEQIQQDPSMSHTSVAGAVIGTVGTIGATAAMFNNGYRAGRMGNLFGKGKNAEIVKKLVDGEKVAGNFKIPFTDLPTRFGIGEKINVTLHGTPETVGGWGYAKSEHGFFGLKEGQGLGYNFSFDKRILNDIENGTINKELLQKNFAERHTIKNADGTFKKVKKRNLTKEEFAELLNDSIDTEKYFINTGGRATISKRASRATTREIFRDIKELHPELADKKDVIRAAFKDALFKKNNGTTTFESSFNKVAMEKAFAKLKKEGIEISEHNIEKITARTIEKSAAKFAAKKVAKYAALSPMLAAGPVGAFAAGVIGTGFLAFDIVTGIKAISDVNSMVYDAKKEKNKMVSAKGRSESFERASNQVSMSAASSGFQTIQQSNFGLSNLIRTKNMAGSFLSEKLWG